MIDNDGFDARYLGAIDSDADRSDALTFLYHNTAYGPNGPEYDLAATAADYQNSATGAATLIQDQKAFASVLQAMNPDGDASRELALRKYYSDTSFPEQYRDWANSDAGSLLVFNGKIALSGAAGAGLAATGELVC